MSGFSGGIQALVQGSSVSPWPNPNILYKGLSGAGLIENQNALLQGQREQQQINATDLEMVSRASAYLNNFDEAKQAELWPGVVQTLQANGFAKQAPTQYPGAARIAQLANMGVSAEKQLDWAANIAANKAYSNATAPGAAPAPSAGGASTGGTTTLAIPARGTGGPGATAQLPPEYLQYFREASAATGIPMDLLIAQARQESTFNPNATGANGEIGIFQIKPSTAQSPGFGLTGVDPATLRDPRANIMFGAQYLKARMGGGDPNDPAVQARGLAAYNGGGDPNYVANVWRYRPGLSPSDPAARVTTYATTPPAQTVATTGAPGDGRYVVASTGSVPPPTGTPGAPAQPTGGSGATVAQTPPAATTAPPQAQPGYAAGAPQPPRLAVNDNGLTTTQQRQIDALASNPRTTLAQRIAAENQFRTQNQAAQEKALADWVAQQQLAVSQGQLSVAQGNQAIEIWKVNHPDAKITTAGDEIITQDPRTGAEIAPRIKVTPQRADAAALATVQRLGPLVAAGTATPEQLAEYAPALELYREPTIVTNNITKAQTKLYKRADPFPPPGAGTSTQQEGQPLTQGLSPAQQQVERDPAAYKVSESQYTRDSAEINGLSDAVRQAQADQVRVHEMQDVLQRFSTGPGTEWRTAASAFLQRWLPAAVSGWEKESANLSGAEAAQAFSKLALVGAGTQERSTLGARGGYQAIKLFKEANPNVNLQDATNKSILDMQLISNQANADYAQAALDHFANNEKKFGETHQYDSLAQFDRNWNAQRNPQVYAAAMGAISGQPASQWTKGLSDEEYARALQMVSRAKPDAVVNTKSGRYSMQPTSVTTGATGGGGNVIRYDASGNRIQ